MSDERLRELERRFRETGDPKDEAAWLRERARSGTLPTPQLELAAALGHEPSRLALDGGGDWRGVAALFASSAPNREQVEQADRWSARLWQEAPEFARRAWLKLATLTLKHHGQSELAQRVGKADDAELARMAQSADETLRSTHPARGICFELSDDQVEDLQRRMRSWERDHVGERVVAELPQVLERAREGSVLKTHRVLLEDSREHVQRFAAWVQRQHTEPGKVQLRPPPGD